MLASAVSGRLPAMRGLDSFPIRRLTGLANKEEGRTNWSHPDDAISV